LEKVHRLLGRQDSANHSRRSLVLLTDRKLLCSKFSLGTAGEISTHDRTGRYGKRAPLSRDSFAMPSGCRISANPRGLIAGASWRVGRARGCGAREIF